MKQMEPFTKGGGHDEAEFSDLGLLDAQSLTGKTGEVVIVSHLNKLEVFKIVHDDIDSAEVKEKMLYFIENREVKVLLREKLLMKPTKELKYVHYLLRVEYQTSRSWSNMIIDTIRRRIQFKK